MSTVRKPLQQRSQETWDRLISVGMELLVDEGVEGLKLEKVCEKAGVSRTSIYARVDGMREFFEVIYQKGMKSIKETRTQLFNETLVYPAASNSRVTGIVTALVTTFQIHNDFLKPVIAYSNRDSALSLRGGSTSREVIDEMVELLKGFESDAAFDTARMLQQECVMRTMYGNSWLTESPESTEEFINRLSIMALARLRYTQ